MKIRTSEKSRIIVKREKIIFVLNKNFCRAWNSEWCFVLVKSNVSLLYICPHFTICKFVDSPLSNVLTVSPRVPLFPPWEGFAHWRSKSNPQVCQFSVSGELKTTSAQTPKGVRRQSQHFLQSYSQTHGNTAAVNWIYPLAIWLWGRCVRPLIALGMHTEVNPEGQSEHCINIVSYNSNM